MAGTSAKAATVPNKNCERQAETVWRISKYSNTNIREKTDSVMRHKIPHNSAPDTSQVLVRFQDPVMHFRES
jgi:hypothetical protein